MPTRIRVAPVDRYACGDNGESESSVASPCISWTTSSRDDNCITNPFIFANCTDDANNYVIFDMNCLRP